MNKQPCSARTADGHNLLNSSEGDGCERLRETPMMTLIITVINSISLFNMVWGGGGGEAGGGGGRGRGRGLRGGGGKQG